MEKVRKIQRRIVMTLIGITLAGISVGMFNFSQFGMDPFQVLAHGISYHLPFGYGFFSMVFNFLILAVVFFVDRSKIGIGTVFNMFFVGYIVEYSSWFLKYSLPNPSFALRCLFMIMAVIIMCFGSSLYFTANLGVSPYDAIALIISEKGKLRFKYCRLTGDFISTGIGFALGATVGFGTLVTAMFMGPIIEVFNGIAKMILMNTFTFNRNYVGKGLRRGK